MRVLASPPFDLGTEPYNPDGITEAGSNSAESGGPWDMGPPLGRLFPESELRSDEDSSLNAREEEGDPDWEPLTPSFEMMAMRKDGISFLLVSLDASGACELANIALSTGIEDLVRDDDDPAASSCSISCNVLMAGLAGVLALLLEWWWSGWLD